MKSEELSLDRGAEDGDFSDIRTEETEGLRRSALIYRAFLPMAVRVAARCWARKVLPAAGVAEVTRMVF